NLGIVLFQKGEIDEAIAHYRKTLQMRPDFSDADYNLGNALLQKGKIDEAIVHCRRAVMIQPNDPDASFRNGTRAVELAGQANQLSGGTNTLVLRTLAAAYAESGQFGKAIEIARAALQLARTQGDNSLASAFQQEIPLYELGLPYREAK